MHLHHNINIQTRGIVRDICMFPTPWNPLFFYPFESERSHCLDSDLKVHVSCARYMMRFVIGFDTARTLVRRYPSTPNFAHWSDVLRYHAAIHNSLERLFSLVGPFNSFYIFSHCILKRSSALPW
ncbi:hypothetical protein ABW19_dt0201576 [Dactylella cylindrospora]|nr:hypothetical protein ABW19_dt0201576 [Dactylella cylindrospora]